MWACISCLRPRAPPACRTTPSCPPARRTQKLHDGKRNAPHNTHIQQTHSYDSHTISTTITDFVHAVQMCLRFAARAWRCPGRSGLTWPTRTCSVVHDLLGCPSGFGLRACRWKQIASQSIERMVSDTTESPHSHTRLPVACRGVLEGVRAPGRDPTRVLENGRRLVRSKRQGMTRIQLRTTRILNTEIDFAVGSQCKGSPSSDPQPPTLMLLHCGEPFHRYCFRPPS
jgi:hypothetical protein